MQFPDHSSEYAPQLAGLILCGGESRRMGEAKYRLKFGEETLLQRICRIVGTIATPVVIVAAEDQLIDDVPSGCRVVRDTVAQAGPLQGLADGLAALLSSDGPNIAGSADELAAFATSCDAPLISTDVIQFLASRLTSEFDAVIVRSLDRIHPLCAVYRVRPAHVACQRLLNAGQRRLQLLAESLRTNWIAADELRCVDPELDCLLNCNTPEELVAARDRACARNRSGRGSH